MNVQTALVYFASLLFVSQMSVFGGTSKVEGIVLSKLENLGKRLGFDSKTEEIRTLGVYRMKSDMFGRSTGIALIRDRGHKIASLEARKQILQYLKINMSARRDYDFHNSYDNSGVYDVRSFVELFSERILTGWRVEASAEAYEGDDYIVAVVVAWSPASERSFLDLKKGLLRPAENWKDELLTYIKSQDLSSWADVRVYIDSVGYPHLLGIGISDWDANVRARSLAVMKAEITAQKNLVHGLYGDATAREIAMKLWNETFSHEKEGKSQTQVYASMLDAQYHGTKPKGINSIYVGKITGLKNDTMISIYSYEPPFQNDFVGNNGELRQEDVLETKSNTNHIKVFNPHTGKFE